MDAPRKAGGFCFRARGVHGVRRELRAATAAPAGPAVDPATAGTVTATVTFEGTPPAPKMMRLEGDPKCVTENGGRERADESLVVGENQALQNVFVYVKDGLGAYGFPVPTEPVVLDQDKCRYTPRVLGVRVGQPLSISNSDPLLHNVRANGTINQGFNMSTPLEGVSFQRTFATKEVMVPFKCDVHGVDDGVRRRARSSVLRHHRARRQGRARQPAAGHLHHRSVARDARHQDTTGHHRGERIEGCRIHLRTLRRTPAPASERIHALGDYVTLTKPRLNFLVLLTVAAAYSLGAPPTRDIARFRAHARRHISRRRRRGGAQSGVGARHRSADAADAAAADGRHADVGRGRRVIRRRADGDRRGELAYFVNPLSAAVALLTTASYVLFYTPLKLRTSLSTIAGALPGALPAVIGWAAATNTLSIEAGCCSASSSCGRCRISSPSPGCIATNTRARECRCCR